MKRTNKTPTHNQRKLITSLYILLIFFSSIIPALCLGIDHLVTPNVTHEVQFVDYEMQETFRAENWVAQDKGKYMCVRERNGKFWKPD